MGTSSSTPRAQRKRTKFTERLTCCSRSPDVIEQLPWNSLVATQRKQRQKSFDRGPCPCALISISQMCVSPEENHRWGWIQKTFRCSASCVLCIRADDRDFFLIGEDRSVGMSQSMQGCGCDQNIHYSNVKGHRVTSKCFCVF